MFTLFTSICITGTNFTIRENELLNLHNVSKTCSIRDGIHHLPLAGNYKAVIEAMCIN